MQVAQVAAVATKAAVVESLEALEEEEGEEEGTGGGGGGSGSATSRAAEVLLQKIHQSGEATMESIEKIVGQPILEKKGDEGGKGQGAGGAPVAPPGGGDLGAPPPLDPRQSVDRKSVV